jgi:putative SOS response-associated peptidase YedK
MEFLHALATEAESANQWVGGNMCGRFVRFSSWAEVRRTMTLLSPSENPPELPPSYNVAPTQNILVVREHEGKREGAIMRWGLIPSWAKDKKMAQINARADSASEKPMFRAAFKKRRCLILADGWYEWKGAGKQKQPFYFQRKDTAPMLFAGLWETWEDEEGPIESCAILTTDANELTREVHNRMPVILAEEDARTWLAPGDDKELLNTLLRPFSPEKLAFHAVDAMVGNVRNNSSECIRQSA